MSSTALTTAPVIPIVTGPTASGKSALAMDLANRLGGTVINADSMQVYRDLRILTARPSLEDEAKVPHRLFGVLAGSERGSAAWWRDQALTQIRSVLDNGGLPILCGGTGLYIRALTDGIADIPDIPADTVEAAKARYDEIGGEAFREELAALDPETASRLYPGDSQRLQRAWSVVQATGTPLSVFQSRGHAARSEYRFRLILVDPPRGIQIDAINRRLDAMAELGAIEEVRALQQLGLPRDLPLMRALGVPQFIEFIEKRCSLDEALEAAKVATRQYAKRQRTWFRHQIVPNYHLEEQYSERLFEEIFPEIRKTVLTR